MREKIRDYRRRFRIVASYSFNPRKGWKPFQKYKRGSIEWEFSPRKITMDEEGVIESIRGDLRKWNAPFEEKTTFCYQVKEGELYIACESFTPQGRLDFYMDEIYKVERINRREYWLHSIHDPEYPGAYKIRRIRL